MDEEDTTFTDALDKAQYQKRIGASAAVSTAIAEEEDAVMGGYLPEETLIEDESGMEISRDKFGRLVVRHFGKITYLEGKDK